MRGIKRVVLVLTLCCVVLVVFAFVLQNQKDVALSFLWWHTPQMPVSVFITMALIVGMLTGPVISAGVTRSRIKPPRSEL